MSILRPLLAVLGIVGSVAASADSSRVSADAQSAAAWIATALTSSGYKADFSLKSLIEVDRFIDDQAPNGQPKPGGLLSERLGSRVFALGGYVGEVLRRTYGGEWKGNDADPQAEINIELVLKSGSTLWPIQRVMKRLKTGHEEALYAYGLAAGRP
jgi:hypothetical protein